MYLNYFELLILVVLGNALPAIDPALYGGAGDLGLVDLDLVRVCSELF